MKRKYSAVFIILLIHQICASTKKTPSEGKWNYLMYSAGLRIRDWIVCVYLFSNIVRCSSDTGRAQALSGLPVNNGRFEYAVALVERVNRNGKRHSPHKHFIKYEHSGVRTGTVYYRLTAFERTFQFRLERDDSFVSPALTVEHVYSDARRLPFAGDLQHCFYRGEVQGDPNSTAVFNLCNGLVGVLALF